MSQFEYVAVLISIIAGLALTQILRGVGRMVTDKNGPAPYWVHLIWTFYLFLYIVAFWWWEFRLDAVEWSLSLYLVIIIYATLLFFASLVIQPGSLHGVDSYKEYFYLRRRWIFSLIIAASLWDFLDTYVKGAGHFESLGIVYPAIMAMVIVGSVIAIITTNERYHKIFSVVWLFSWSSFLYQNFFVID